MPIEIDYEYCINVLSIEKNNQTNLLSIFPNPVNSVLNITCEGNISEVKLYTLAGEKLMNYKKTSSIDVSHLKSGIYFISIEMDNQQIITSKFVKE